MGRGDIYKQIGKALVNQGRGLPVIWLFGSDIVEREGQKVHGAKDEMQLRRMQDTIQSKLV